MPGAVECEHKRRSTCAERWAWSQRHPTISWRTPRRDAPLKEMGLALKKARHPLFTNRDGKEAGRGLRCESGANLPPPGAGGIDYPGAKTLSRARGRNAAGLFAAA